MPEFDESVGAQSNDGFCGEDVATERWLEDPAPYMRVEYEGEMTEGGDEEEGGRERPVPDHRSLRVD